MCAKRDNQIKDAFVFKKNKYKVSIIYWAKLILVSETLFHHIKLYICYLRPLLIVDKHRLDRERCLFVSSKSDAAESKAVQLQHITLGWCLTATCERSGVFENVEGAQNRMSTSRIRFSFTTELVSLGEDSLDNIAYCFGFWIISIMITTSKENTVILKNTISHRQKRILQFLFLHWKLLLK